MSDLAEKINADESIVDQEPDVVESEDPNAPLVFSTKLKIVPIVIEDENGVPQDYVLRELNGDERDTYTADMGRRTTMQNGKPTGLSDYKNLYSGLVALSLRMVDSSGNYRGVKQDVIQKWPSTVITALFRKVKEISGLDDDAEDDAKNE